MEHPTGHHRTAVDAMEEAISRLRHLPAWDRWITFSAQGQGEGPDSIHFAELRILSDILEVGTILNIATITGLARVPRTALAEAGGGRYSVANASAREAALILDALFRHQLGIRPFEDENDDYAVGAEWQSGPR